MDKMLFPMERPGLGEGSLSTLERRVQLDLHNEAILSHQENIDIVFIGDSITHFWNLQSYFGSSGQRIENRGMGWDMTGFTLQRFNADVIQLKPKYVIIMIGINNTWALESEHPQDNKTADQIEREFAGDLQAMIQRSLHAVVQPIVCSLIPTCNETPSTHSRNRLIRALNERLQRLSAEYGIIYIDYHTAMCELDGLTLNKQLTYDGIHPDVYGYGVMAEALRNTVMKYGIRL
ncbi:SGNH/GDSL hydrolase family protein [Cohnella luojiensis]|nr:GDSL-type esterase/lipase family protein [Cohnella luojiensis]